MNDTSATAPTPDETPETRRRRRWYQFSLRTLLILVPLCAIFLGWVGVQWHRWYRGQLREAAIRAIEQAGGPQDRTVDGQLPRISLSRPDLDDDELRRLIPHLRNVDELEELSLVATSVTDEGLLELSRVRQLRVVNVFASQVTDDGIDRLKQQRPDLAIRNDPPDPVGTKLAMRKIYRNAVVALAFDPTGRLLATGSGDGVLRLRKDSSLVSSVQAHEKWLFSVAFGPDGTSIATGGGDGLVKLWDTATMRETAVLHGHEDDVHAIAYNPGGELLYSAGDEGDVFIWNVPEQRRVGVLSGHCAAITALAVSSDGRLLASSGRDHTIRLWEMSTGRELHVFDEHTGDVSSIALSPDNRLLASASYDCTVRLWNTDDFSEHSRLVGHDDWVFSVRFSPDGRFVASGAGDGTVRVWDVDTGAALATHTGQANVAAIAFAPVSGIMATAAADGNVYLRDEYSLTDNYGQPTVLWNQFHEPDRSRWELATLPN